MIACPFCDGHDTGITDSRPTEHSQRRRRHCRTCDKRFTTYEYVGAKHINMDALRGQLVRADRSLKVSCDEIEDAMAMVKRIGGAP